MLLPTPLVTVEELSTALENADVVVLDCSWYLPTEPRDPEAEFLEGHIPGAQRFDFDGEVAAKDTHLPHMLPTPEAFEAAARGLGISKGTHVVCYDGAGIFASPRVWWMFRAMGHEKVSVLDGGFPAWQAADYGLEKGAARKRSHGNFATQFDPQWVRNAAEVQTALNNPDALVLDARPAARFAGQAPEPRPGLRSGAMPGAVNLPFSDLVENGRMKSAAALGDRLTQAGAVDGRAIVASCGSGVTAAVIALAAIATGREAVAVYDGSWAEWGDENRPDLPVVNAGE